MKKILIFTFLVFLSIRGSTQPCEPDSNNYYLYYVNLNIDRVSNTFNKEDFLILLERNEEELSEAIVRVEKSFPTAVTDFLQHSISIYGKREDLVPLMVSEQFNLVEFAGCEQMILLYQPNDYGNIQTPIKSHNNSHLELINAKEAWEITKGDGRVIVGVNDTYLDTTHTDLISQIDTVEYNVRRGSWSDRPHGTRVSGCVAATTDNAKGISSIGFKSKIAFTTRPGHNAVNLMAQNPNIRVINLSWGNDNYSATTAALYQTMLDSHNTVIVSGAGNEPAHGGENGFFYPAAYPSVISVTSVGHRRVYGYTDTIYGGINWADCHEEYIGIDSNGYSTHHHNTAVNICAPGYNVKTLDYGGGYIGDWGTSFASPIVAGVCALVVAVNPCLTAVEVKDIVLSTADPTIYQIPENQPYIGLLGTGRVDAYTAVLRALNLGTEYIQKKTYSTTNAVTESAETAMYAGFEVTNTQAKGLVTVNSTANVTFEATHSIILSEGFEVKNNAFFEAKIIDSRCW